MKAGTESTIKFKRFQRRLDLREWEARGILESIWAVTARSRPRGDIGNGYTNEDIAAAIDWMGDEDDLINVLIDCGWLDADDEFRLIVHDWDEHCPAYVKGNVVRHGKQFANTVAKDRPKEPPKDSPNDIPKEHPQGIVPPSLAYPSQVKPSVNTVATDGSNGADVKPRKRRVISYTEDFEAFWKAYPANEGGRKHGKEKAFLEWKKLDPSEFADVMTATGNYAVDDRLKRDPERFLRGNWWKPYLESVEPARSKGNGKPARTTADELLDRLAAYDKQNEREVDSNE